MIHRLATIGFLRWTAVTAGAAVVVVLLPVSSARAGVEPVPFLTGLVVVAPGDVARLNVANLVPPDPIRERRACEAVLTFFDANGQPLVDEAGALVTQKVDLAAGQTTSLDLSWRSTNMGADPSGIRAQVRAYVVLVSRRRGEPCAHTAATLEIDDETSGRTSVLLHSESLVGFNPQPEPPAPAGVR
jgi:hypothetical protein